MPEQLKLELLKIFPQDVIEVNYKKHKWQVKKRPHHQDPDAWFVEIHYWDRRLRRFYRVWKGKWQHKRLRGRFQIDKHPDGDDFTPVAQRNVYALAQYINVAFRERFGEP